MSATIVGVGVKEDLIESRAASALTLRQFDDDARRMGVRHLAGRLAKQRNLLVDLLTAVGGQPWPYSPDVDNSWLPCK